MGRWTGHANVPAGQFLSIRVSIDHRHAKSVFSPPLPASADLPPIAWRSLPSPHRRGSLPSGGFSAGRGERSRIREEVSPGHIVVPLTQVVISRLTSCVSPLFRHSRYLTSHVLRLPAFQTYPLSRGVRYPLLTGEGPCLAVVFRQAGGRGLRGGGLGGEGLGVRAILLQADC